MDFPISVPSIGLVDGQFVDENPLLGTPGSLIPSAWGNSITHEVLNVIEAAGLVRSEADLTQLLQAIRLINQADVSKFGVDTGAANVYAVAYVPAIPALVSGQLLRFKAKTTNAGASTFSQNGGPAKALVGLALTALQGGEIVADGLCTVMYSAALDQCILLSCTGGALQIAAASKSLHAMQLGQATGRLLRHTRWINVAGVMKVSVDGGAFVNAAATFTKHSLAKRARRRVQGGGGKGGNAYSTAAGQVAAGCGGGGGGWAEDESPIEDIDGMVVAVGAGGDVGIPAGTTSFGGDLSATGGAQGSDGANASPSGISSGIAVGGVGVGGDISGQGGQGGYGLYMSTPQQGYGGSSLYGAGGTAQGGAPTTGTAGFDALSYGAGGGGAANGASVPANKVGGKGKCGIAECWEFS